MASYQSGYTGATIDRAGRLPAPTSGSIGQFLRKVDAAGNMEFADVKQAKVFANVTLSASTAQWIASGISGYPYKYAYSNSQITDESIVIALFDDTVVQKGAIAPFCDSGSGCVYFYATSRPDLPITISTLLIF